jgi:hypothetical protein
MHKNLIEWEIPRMCKKLALKFLQDSLKLQYINTYVKSFDAHAHVQAPKVT